MAEAIRFYTESQLGSTRYLTPEGFLLCMDVALARTGSMTYADGEIPVESNSDGLITIYREAEDVFHPHAIISFAGKPVTNEHPTTKVDPDNWKEHAVGVVLDPRRGDGAKYDNDFLYADLLITDRDTIKDILEGGKREVSAGYDAHYEQIKPGEGRQHEIIGNHVALVDKGRCGQRCAIGDSDMAGKAKNPFRDSLRATILNAHRTGDTEVLVDTLEKIPDMLGTVWLGMNHPSAEGADAEESKEKREDEKEEETKDAEGGCEASAALSKRVEALERAVAILADGDESTDKKKRTKDEKREDDEDEDDKEEKKEAKDSRRTRDEESEKEEEKEEKKEEAKDSRRTKDEESEKEEEKEDKKESKDRKAAVGDSSSLKAAWQDLLVRAEFLAPGIKHPTFDSKSTAVMTTDAMCKFRRKVINEALKEDDTKAAILQLTGDSSDLSRMTCDALTIVYNGASQIMRQANTRSVAASNVGAGRNYNADNVALQTVVANINATNRKKYGYAN